jgi:ferric-dicitrate binding protein FerR (iron transport regulator)
LNIEEWSGYEVSEGVLEQAANWLAVLDSENLDNNQQIAFYDWLQQQASHQQAYLELSELWAKSSCIKSMEHLVETSKVLPFPSHLPRPEFQTNIPQTTASPAWAYSLTIGLILVGLSLPIVQNII